MTINAADTIAASRTLSAIAVQSISIDHLYLVIW